jgi:SulP family sulfate permease
MYAAHTRKGAPRFAFDWSRLFPFLRWRDRVTRASTRDDAMAGLTGALIVLPQGVAFAIIAGLPPEYGLYAAMMPAIVAALFGSSWHLVSGPLPRSPSPCSPRSVPTRRRARRSSSAWC